jgi:hypothetical protein
MLKFVPFDSAEFTLSERSEPNGLRSGQAIRHSSLVIPPARRIHKEPNTASLWREFIKCSNQKTWRHFTFRFRHSARFSLPPPTSSALRIPRRARIPAGKFCMAESLR